MKDSSPENNSKETLSSHKTQSDLAESVETVSAPWKESPYYQDAEQNLHVFWNENTVFRRLFSRLNLTSAVELAVGHGRHAEIVAPKAGELTVIDIFEENLSVCRRRLKEHRNVAYSKCEGFAFDGVDDGQTSSVYCYDAMVHFSPVLVKSYLDDAKRILKPGGRGLFHHSNYPAPLDRHYGLNVHARNHMTQELFWQYCRDSGLSLLISVPIDWGGESYLDCVTLVENS